MKKPEVLCCDNFSKKREKGRCSGKYCNSCLEKHYNTSIDEITSYPVWQCFRCNKICECAQCKRERGIDVPIKKRKRIENINEQSLHALHTKLNDRQEIKSLVAHTVNKSSKKKEMETKTQLTEFFDMQVLAETALRVFREPRQPNEELDSMSKVIQRKSQQNDHSNHVGHHHCVQCQEITTFLESEIQKLKQELKELKEMAEILKHEENVGSNTVGKVSRGGIGEAKFNRAHSYPLKTVLPSFNELVTCKSKTHSEKKKSSTKLFHTGFQVEFPFTTCFFQFQGPFIT